MQVIATFPYMYFLCKLNTWGLLAGMAGGVRAPHPATPPRPCAWVCGMLLRDCICGASSSAMAGHLDGTGCCVSAWNKNAGSATLLLSNLQLKFSWAWSSFVQQAQHGILFQWHTVFLVSCFSLYLCSKHLNKFVSTNLFTGLWGLWLPWEMHAAMLSTSFCKRYIQWFHCKNKACRSITCT